MPAKKLYVNLSAADVARVKPASTHSDSARIYAERASKHRAEAGKRMPSGLLSADENRGHHQRAAVDNDKKAAQQVTRGKTQSESVSTRLGFKKKKRGY